MLVSKKISAKFRPNFAKFGNFGGGRNFCDNEIKNLALVIPNVLGEEVTSVPATARGADGVVTDDDPG